MRQLRSLCCSATLLIATAAVLLAGAGSWWGLAALIAVTLYVARDEWRGHFIGPTPEEPQTRNDWVWTGSFLVALGLSFARAFIWQDILDSGIDFLMFAACQRRLDPTIRPGRRCAQLLLIAVVTMMIAAAVNTEVTFPPLLAAFLGFSVMTLQLNAALSVVEDHGRAAIARVEREAPRHLRHITRSGLEMTAFAALCGLLVFVFFPRFGVGAFLRGALPSRSTSGFSEEVQLGHFGTIREDTRIVMHLRDLQLPTASGRPLPKPNLPIHLRATAFDHYEAGRWSHSPEALSSPLIRSGGYHMRKVEPRPIEPAELADLHMEVLLADIDTDLLFAASHVVGINLRARGVIEGRSRIIGGVDEQFRVLHRPPGTIQYEFLSRLARPSRALLAQSELPQAGESAELSAYLQIPETVAPALAELRASWQLELGETRLARVEAIMAQLQRYEYTTDAQASELVARGADPIEGFLLDTKAGHCEYFSTALTLLARAAGIPARNVNGYHGASFNPHGEFYVVRQSNAHSWTEIYFPDHGWLTFDATPPDARTPTPARNALQNIRAWFESVQDDYLRYIIDYDFRKQLDMLSSAGVDLRRGPGRFSIDRAQLLRYTGSIALLLVAFVVYRKSRRFSFRPQARIARCWQRALKDLERAGWKIGPTQSPTAFAQRVAAHREHTDGRGQKLIEFAQAYEALRFGPETQVESAMAQLLTRADALTRSKARNWAQGPDR